jgi:hypothetical protein
MDDEATGRVAEAMCRAHRALNPDPAELIEAVVAGWARDDLQARHRELRARMEGKYGPMDEMFGRLQGRPGIAGRVWC